MLSVRLLLSIAHIHGLDSKSIGFLLAFPQADIDIDVLMELPEGMIPVGDESNRRLYILKLNKILYGLKQASHNWYEKLKQYLLDRYFTSSKIYWCIFMIDGMLLLVYVDDWTILSDSDARIDVLIESFKMEKRNIFLLRRAWLINSSALAYLNLMTIDMSWCSRS